MSWFEPEANPSLALIRAACPNRDAAIIDVGGGASTLVDGLLAAGYHDITVLDLSGSALDQARQRLGDVGATVKWREANVLTVELPGAGFDVWHDRAVFHFLTDPPSRDKYLAQIRHALKPGGLALVATFAEDGPERCSGLDVERYSPDELHRAFGDEFRLLVSRREIHETPWGTEQPFTYFLCRYEPHASARQAA